MHGVKDGNIKIHDNLTQFSQHPELDEWVEKNGPVLAQLVQDMQNCISSIAQYALPAHDQRQIMFKDAVEGLRYYVMEKPQGYKSTFPIAMFGHDLGRLVEGFFYDPEQNPHDEWIPHAQLSFLLFKDILDQPTYKDMPRLLKDHYLYAVLAHSGDNGSSYMARAVQTCDRQQLYGAEGFYRALSYLICFMDGDIRYPDDPAYQHTLPNMLDHTSVFSNLEYVSRNMRENIGGPHKTWQHRISVENVVLLLSCCEGNDDLKHRIFSPELGVDCAYGSFKGKIDPGVWADANNLYEHVKYTGHLRWSPHEVAAAIVEAIENPIGSAKLSHSMRHSLVNAVLNIPETERKALFKTMMIANEFRLEQDELDLDVCLTLENDPNQFIKLIAREATKYAPLVAASDMSALIEPDDDFLPSVSDGIQLAPC